jgi:hypothetical protein
MSATVAKLWQVTNTRRKTPGGVAALAATLDVGFTYYGSWTWTL